MKRLLLFLLLVASILGSNIAAQTAADKITAGRAALAAHDLLTAQARFQEIKQWGQAETGNVAVKPGGVVAGFGLTPLDRPRHVLLDLPGDCRRVRDRARSAIGRPALTPGARLKPNPPRVSPWV